MPAHIETFIPEQQIQLRIAELAASISADYEGKTLVLVGVLKGSFMFMADLARHITIPVRIDFIGTKSYEGTTTSGQVQLTRISTGPSKAKHVLIIEDIIAHWPDPQLYQEPLRTAFTRVAESRRVPRQAISAAASRWKATTHRIHV